MQPKKILILNCLGGYGHIAATKTLIHLLGDKYEIDIANPIRELRIWNIPAGESFYNFLIANNWTRITNFIVRYITPIIFKNRINKTAKLIRKYIAEKDSDMVISVIPFVNAAAIQATRTFGIPLLIATTDGDIKNWVYWLKKEEEDKLKVTIGHFFSTTEKLLTHQGIPKEDMEILGLPLRPEFLEKASKETLRNAYHIPKDKRVVLIMMGGVGAKCLYNYVKTIAESKLGVHLIVCSGKSKHVEKKLKTIEPKLGNSLEIIPFTEKVHELFALSDLILTKPGPGTITEAMAFQLPILIDQTRAPLFWEQANIDLVEKYKIGASIHSYKEAQKLIHQFLNDEQTVESVARAYKNTFENQFANRIPNLVEEMLEASIPTEVVTK